MKRPWQKNQMKSFNHQPQKTGEQGNGYDSVMPRLEFSEKYDEAQAQFYFEKHQEGIGRRVSNWRETGMLRKALKLADDPETVLDLPAGTGRFWEMLAEMPGRKIYAADYSREMLKMGLKMRSAQITGRIVPIQCSAFAIPLSDNSVENVFSARLLHHIGDRANRVDLLREMARVTSRSVCVSLWIDGNYKAGRRKRLEARPRRRRYQNRFVVPRSVVEEDFQNAGLEPVGRIDFMKFYSMWSTYVLRKMQDL